MAHHTDSPHLKAGALVAGKYRLIRGIGEGAMGVVWAAVNEATGREVALKLVVRQDDELRARLLQEARACGRLQNRNIVQVYDVDQTERGEPFLVMPLLQGETLAALIKRRRRLDAHEAARIGRDIARGLSVAHGLKIIHRDLKPSNVFLHSEPDEGEYTVKVLDFGVSKVAAAGVGVKTATGVALGSPAYMSPEQITTPTDVDARADIWALGVVLFEMLSGVRPFQGGLEAALKGILSGEIPSLAQAVRNIDPGLAEIVGRCLQRDRDRRPGSAAEVAALLEAFTAPGAGQQPAIYGADPPALGSWSAEADENVTLPLQRRNPAQAAAGPRAKMGTLRMMPAQRTPAQGSREAMGSAPVLHSPASGQAGVPAQRLSDPQAEPPTLQVQRRPSSRRAGWVALAGSAFTVAVLSGVWAAFRVIQTDPPAPTPPTPESTAGEAPGLTGAPSAEPSASGGSSADPAPAGSSGGDQDAPGPDSTASGDSPIPEPTKPAASTTKPSTPPPRTAIASAPRAPPKPPPPTAPFDQAAADSALARAAAAAALCAAPDTPKGSGKARVLFGGDGSTLSVVLEGPFGNTPIYGCILTAFRGARVPPFAGSTASAVKSFTIR